MINFIIVDDNELQRKASERAIVKKMMSNKIEFTITKFEDYNDKLTRQMSDKSFDKVYILDIELPTLDGIQIAREIRHKYNDWTSPIIILTVHTSLYYEVYKQRLQILDFISKTDNVDCLLSENIDICLKMMNKDKVYRYTYKSVDYNINFNHIDYIQRDGRKIKIVTTNGDYYQNISINKIKEMLPNYFLLSAKGIIINLKNVKKIDWQKFNVVFNDEINGYLVSKSHRKEIETYELV
jgi:DNA-binding LytR/AlgR family response regulator